jgi:hypothetical protein
MIGVPSLLDARRAIIADLATASSRRTLDQNPILEHVKEELMHHSRLCAILIDCNGETMEAGVRF